MNDDPLAYFITWTVYGTFLQGDERGWRKWRKGHQIPRLHLAEWRAERLKHSVILLEEPPTQCGERRNSPFLYSSQLDLLGRKCVKQPCSRRHYNSGYSGATVRDQLKANCTRVLRELSERWADRPVWTVGGDWECINTEDDLETVIAYVLEAQDRKSLE